MITAEELWDHLVGHMKDTNDRLAAIDRLQELAGSGHTEKRVEEVEKWIQTLKRCIEDHEQTVQIHQECHKRLNERLDRLGIQQNQLDFRYQFLKRVVDRMRGPESDLVPCPVCEGECYDSSRNGLWDDEPPYQVACSFCGGSGKATEGQAALIQQLRKGMEDVRSELALIKQELTKALPMPIVGQRHEKWQTHRGEI